MAPSAPESGKVDMEILEFEPNFDPNFDSNIAQR